MGKNQFWTSIALGALAGGLISLFKRESRQYASEKASDFKQGAAHCIKHPSETVRQIRSTVSKYNDSFMRNADEAINALEQVEETVEQIQAKPKQIEHKSD